MKKRFLAPLILVMFVVSGVVSGLIWWNGATKAPMSDLKASRFLITKGMSAGEIAKKLQREGLIKSELAFRIYVQVNDLSKNIPAGEYDIAPNLNLTGVINILLDGPSEVWVTIPEGLRREEIAEKMVAALKLTISESAIFEKELLNLSAGLEGYLFPDTYLFPRDITADKVVARLNGVFKQKAGEVTLQEAILASLIERETRGNQEKSIVAGIILKRLAAGWPLQIDATVQYAVGSKDSWWPILTKEDLGITSPYNSYTNQGLPPTPIANPGLAAIKAAQNPEESPYWFYIHDASGQIHYAATLEEHNLNIKNYLGK